MKPLSNPAFERTHRIYATVLVVANRDWQPTDLINRRSGRVWPGRKELLVRLCSATLQSDWCIRQKAARLDDTVWEIRIADGNDLTILRNVIGHDRVDRQTQADGTAVYVFTYDRKDYANWGSVLRTF